MDKIGENQMTKKNYYTPSISFDERIYEKLQELKQFDGINISRFVNIALAEKLGININKETNHNENAK